MTNSQLGITDPYYSMFWEQKRANAALEAEVSKLREDLALATREREVLMHWLIEATEVAA